MAVILIILNCIIFMIALVQQNAHARRVMEVAKLKQKVTLLYRHLVHSNM